MAPRDKKQPLLLLKLSSPSFLDAVATDDKSQKPLYSVETVGSSTTIWRSDPWNGPAKIADIHWPKDLPVKGKCKDNTHGGRVQMNGSAWKDTTSFLKYGSLGSSRKFHVPHHPHTLKWKRSGNLYQCTAAPCKGPVATLECFGLDMEPRLKVLQNLGSTDESVPQLDHEGISLSFLDHLFVTALLLVTEPEDWMTVARHPTSVDGVQVDTLLPPSSASVRMPASARQWRKIMYGEPLYPSLKTPSVDKSAADLNESVNLSTSIRQWRKIVYGEPLYPSLRSRSADSLDLSARPRTAWDNASLSSESACCPATPSSAPSTGFCDPSLLDESDWLVSHINSDKRYVSSPCSFLPTPISPVPSSDHTPISPQTSTLPRARRRELPHPPSAFNPPPPSMQPWLHRSRSSPRLSPENTRQAWGAEDRPRTATTALLDDPDERQSHVSLSTSMRRRQLPSIPSVKYPPQTPPSTGRRLSQRMLPQTPGSVGRVQSYTQTMSPRPPPPRLTQPRSSATEQRGGEPGPLPRQEKDPRELIDWMRAVSSAHHRRLRKNEEDGSPNEEDMLYDAPPPAYNTIDFSTPLETRSAARVDN
ncbi:hypothetical protein ID866_2474 [Astraeus odoratus]|nr:hypothetical protein ID866_2474 [Astraeus odoratus]